eukprot:TRINITY_DN10653_c0_g1_i1.p1 TRINITY_DN10653_c0_g1~~TRINITY_DN10653_c0_g1_i1.p1  ORF type:complete len:209 (+),score=24.16 TRINITY_DN10653_c0_g1_i1:38-628(+)
MMQYSVFVLILIVVSSFATTLVTALHSYPVNAKPRGIINRDFTDKANEQLLMQSLHDVLTALDALLDPSPLADGPCSSTYSPEVYTRMWGAKLFNSCFWTPLRLRAVEVGQMKEAFLETVPDKSAICPIDSERFQMQRVIFDNFLRSFVSRHHLRKPSEAADWLADAANCIARIARVYEQDTRPPVAITPPRARVE